MPRFDPQGRVLSGVGSGVVAIGGVPIARGGVANWLEPGVAIFQNADDDCLYTYDANNPQPTPVKVAASGANALAAGGGHWIAWMPATGLYNATGVIDPHGRLAGVNVEQDGRGAASPDGFIAITNSECVGFTIVGPNGAATLTVPDTIVLSMQVLDARTAVWVDERNQPRAVGLPNPAVPPFGLFAIRTVEIGGTRYVLAGTHTGLVLYAWNDASAGWRFEGLAFYPSIRQAGSSELEISFARGAGELPGDLSTWRVDVARTPKVTFSAPAPPPDRTPTPPAQPPTHPPTQPPREPVMPDVPDALHNQLALVTEVRNTLFPNMVGKPLNDPKKAFAITKNVAWRLRAHGVGLVKAKPGSDNNVEGFTSDVVALANGVHWDVLVDGNEGASFPNWAMEENPANYPPIAARWVAPINPGGTPAPEPDPTPNPTNLKALIAAEVARAVAPLQAEIAALKTKIGQPWPASGAMVRVALKSAHGKYVCVEPSGRLVADRDDVGAWEALDVEPQ